jgi:hypothetical protein
MTNRRHLDVPVAEGSSMVARGRLFALAIVMRPVVLTILSSTLFACALNGGSAQDSAASALDSSESVESEGNVMMAAVDGADMTGAVAVTADQVATRIAANVASRWQPAGCATVTQPSSTQIAIKVNDCTGPRGLVHVTGELDLSVAVSIAGVITVTGTATALEVNGATLTINSTATYGVSNTSHTLTVQTKGSGTGPLGNAIDHSGNYTVTWDMTSQCSSVRGTWSTTLTATTGAAESRSNDVTLMRCAGGCPTGSVVHHGFGGETLTVTFDGTATASWTLSTGRSGTIALTCR